MKLKTCFLTTLVVVLAAGCNNSVVYRDATQPVESRVRDLLGRMTLDEKAAQLDMLDAASLLESATEVSVAKMDSTLGIAVYGSLHDLYPVSAALTNDIQRYMTEHTRLGIPFIVIEEALHGYQGPGGTCFPIPIGNASAWDTTLMYGIGRAIAAEARAHGVHLVLSPNLDLAREPRWGRVEETFGEDPYLASRLAVNIVKGMQGASLKSPDAVISEPKHFGVHGAPESGSNTGPVFIGEREARSTHLYAFEKAVREARAHSVMAAYHELDGIPVAGSHWLMTDVLRNEWGFDGFVISDLGAIALQYNKHRTVGSEQEAIAASLNAGVNMQFYDFSHPVFLDGVVQSVKSGAVSMATLDKLVGEVLRMKFELGLFDNPCTDTTLAARVLHCDAHRDLALQAARQSLTLLKNDSHTLPLRNDIRSIAVVGRLAAMEPAGGYSPRGVRCTTILEALRRRFGDKVRIDWLAGDISSNFSDIPAAALSSADGSEGVDVAFFNSIDLSGKPVCTTVEKGFSHYWHNLSPAPGVSLEPFSARFSGTIHVATAGVYEFSFVADNYGRVIIDGKTVFDRWDDKFANVTTTAQAYLDSGREIPVVVEYAKCNDFAGLRIKWRYVGGESLADVNRRTARAVAAADAVIVVLGESAEEVGESKDRHNLALHQLDIDLLRAVASTGKPVATVLFNGRPLILGDVDRYSQAILEAWLPGEASGDAVCDALFGDVNPSGKLTMSFPRSMGQLPIYYNRKNSAARSSIDGSPDPLYPFGHGLSYTTFEYSSLQVSPDAPTVADNITVSLDVRNTGNCAGTEVVQLYVRDMVSSVTTPVKALKGFSRVELAPGETRRVAMTLTPEHLSLINRDMKRVTEPGDFEIMVGSSSADIRLSTQLTVLEH
jgi:beta-glucosidase